MRKSGKLGKVKIEGCKNHLQRVMRLYKNQGIKKAYTLIVFVGSGRAFDSNRNGCTLCRRIA